MVEWDGLEWEVGRRAVDERRPIDPVVTHEAGRRVEIGDEDGMCESRKHRPDLLDDAQPIKALAGEDVAVDGDQDLRLDLNEAIDDAARTELRGAAGPDRAETCGRQQSDDRLGDVRDDSCDPIAATDTQIPEPGGRRRDGLAQLVPRNVPPESPFGASDEGRSVRRGSGKDGLGVVEGGALEPDGAGHPVVGEDACRRRPKRDLEEVDDGSPERLGVVHGPAPSSLVIIESVASGLLEPGKKRGHERIASKCVGRLPEDVALHHGWIAHIPPAAGGGSVRPSPQTSGPQK